MLRIYTDGACSGNGRANAVGGWAYIILNDDNEIVAQGAKGEKNTTNQRMELIACLEGCREAERINPFAQVEIYSDSAYLINCYKQNWWKSWRCNGWKNSKKEPVANQDLWEQLIGFFIRTPQYNFIKVRGHAGDMQNELVDSMAVRARENVE